MKSPKMNLALITLLALALLPAYGNIARAELEDQEIAEDSIVPESSDTLADQGEAVLHEEVIVRKKRPSYQRVRAPKRRVIIQEVEASEEDESSDNAQAKPAASVGSTIDSSIDKKLNGARTQIESKIAEAIDGIQISIGNGSAPATATVVQDQAVQVSAAPNLNEKAYLTVDEAPKADGAESQADLKSGESLKGQMSLTPLFGLSTISSGKTGGYNPESDYTAGLGLEVEVSDNMSFMGSYRFAKYNIRLAGQNQFPIYGNYNNVYSGYGYGNNQDLNSLKYSQNVFDAGMRLYLLPKEYRYRFFVGAGMGYQRGYLNYSDRTLDLLKSNPSLRSSGYLDDFEITQILFNAEAGGEVNLSKSIAIGGLFRYSTVVSSSTQDTVNSGWYNNSGFAQYGQATDKTIVGASLANSGFYTILGTLKYTF